MLHFLLSFTANLVSLPLMDVFLSMALMTPVAAICLMSHTTKWPEEEGRMRHRREDSLASVRGPFLSFPGLSSHYQSLALLELGIQRRSPHTWPCWGPSAQ